jgi:YfiH family protein
VEPPAPFFWLGEHLAIDLPGARAVFTTRHGGHSTGPYASLNLGLNTDDDPGVVRRNHDELGRALGLQLAPVRQVHGTQLHRLEAAPGGPPPEADGQITTQAGLGAMVLVADCLPIVVAVPGALAVLHAGWRGLAGGIVAAGVRALLDAAPGPGAPIAAAIGPGAGGCCYEVGNEVRAAFTDRAHVTDGRRLDLKAVARADLERAGISEVHDICMCTLHDDATLLFSHRRDHGVTGRQAGVAWLS